MLSPLEGIMIAVVAIVFLMFGPKKIPELAKSIGLARKEFNNASAIASGNESAVASAPASAATPQPTISSGDALLDTAKKLGIHTEGKSRQEISAEIVSRAGT